MREREGEAPSIIDIGTAFSEPAPFTADARRAVQCWNWIGGWQPERLPVFLALHPGADVDLLVEGLQVIREQS